MPKLLLFAPCERVIVSREGPISLVTVLEGVNINIPENQEGLPADAVIPISWQVVTIWLRANDEEKLFEQRVQLVLPDGRIPTDATSTFDMATNQRLRNIVEISGFPVSPTGHCAIKLSLRSAGENDWQEIATYPLTITRVNPE